MPAPLVKPGDRFVIKRTLDDKYLVIRRINARGTGPLTELPPSAPILDPWSFDIDDATVFTRSTDAEIRELEFKYLGTARLCPERDPIEIPGILYRRTVDNQVG